MHHLHSIHHAPFHQLTEFSIRRLVHPIHTVPFPGPAGALPTISPYREAQRISPELLDAIVEHGRRLKTLCLDWWLIGPEDLPALLLALPQVSVLQLGIAMPFIKLVREDSLLPQRH